MNFIIRYHSTRCEQRVHLKNMWRSRILSITLSVLVGKHQNNKNHRPEKSVVSFSVNSVKGYCCLASKFL